jgi:tripartite-type tricarboxylate transporter receptor subunit TctC
MTKKETSMQRRSLAALAVAALAAVAALPTAHAQASRFPDRPLKLIVPYAPGGSVDIIGRLIAAKLSTSLGQQVVVENRGGGGATIGTAAVARSPADGYTLLLADIALGASPALMAKLPYDTAKDLQPVGLVAVLPSLLVVEPSVAAKSVRELVAQAKAAPGKLNYASSGVGSLNFLATEQFKSSYGVDLVHIPFQSGGQAVTALLGAQAQVMIATIPPALPQVKAGKLRALAVSGAKRQPSVADVPTFAEAGYPDFDVSLWQGLLVPAGTPPDVVARLNAEVNKLLAMPDVRERLAELGAEAAGGTPEQFATLIRNEVARWGRLIKPEQRIQ